jgi:adenine/guanine/hypoxanthine permease
MSNSRKRSSGPTRTRPNIPRHDVPATRRVAVPPPPPTAKNAVDRYFKITERGSTTGREIRGGLVTFFTMAYIVVLNPLIIGTQADADGQFLGGGTAPNLPLVAAATALVAGVMTILMGAYANFPLALATGLGLNAFVTFAIAKQMTWADAMGIVVIEGVIITVLVLTGLRRAVFNAVPRELKVAISVGIGLFIAFIGLVDAGFVRRSQAPTPVPVELGVGGLLAGWPVLVFVAGLIAMIIMLVRGVKGAILIGIIGADRARRRRRVDCEDRPGDRPRRGV